MSPDPSSSPEILPFGLGWQKGRRVFSNFLRASNGNGWGLRQWIHRADLKFWDSAPLDESAEPVQMAKSHGTQKLKAPKMKQYSVDPATHKAIQEDSQISGSLLRRLSLMASFYVVKQDRKTRLTISPSFGRIYALKFFLETFFVSLLRNGQMSQINVYVYFTIYTVYMRHPTDCQDQGSRHLIDTQLDACISLTYSTAPSSRANSRPVNSAAKLHDFICGKAATPNVVYARQKTLFLLPNSRGARNY
ncbi:uncharacterized protein BT62DRAFT_1074783 [Guyanagaster necrorhizus]|uniref:Uncharacterized protein n=1 Tax=Guyanagaster necrorhizus TaxID=856835 RepID=A0A9P7VXC7_9AGAR|nr:uncharacterized protein BT62DRAFT_1074783 [Guyanagaster necrorhizus MCA 3950]KAG7448302.1 hypothetical protein BT62DRAFT_1074783 [Guyanagaster necrorhizus MCA 3950]